MSALTTLLHGPRGHPVHPPLTDVSIGAYTVGTLMLVLGALGVYESEMAYGGFLAITGGLIFAVPTAITGLLDWLKMQDGTAAKQTATVHMLLMVTTTVAFAVAWLLQRPGFTDDTIRTGGWLAATVAEILLLAGGWFGGKVVFDHGYRVVGDNERIGEPAAERSPAGAPSSTPAQRDAA